MTANDLPLNQATVTDLLPTEAHQKGRYAELMTSTLVGDLLGEPFPHFDDTTVYGVDSEPLICCIGARFQRPRAMCEAASGRGGHGGYGRTSFFYGFKLHAVIDDHGLIVRFAISS